MTKRPLLIDCDPGVDDSFAIILANSCPDLEIVAITAVEGNVPAKLTRKNALCLREALGLNCRVGFGAELPLEKEYTQSASEVHGETGVGDVKFPEPTLQVDAMPAWDLIYDEAVKHQGKLELIALGPLTNIALALRHHPDLPKYIRRFTIMGGGTFGNMPVSEFTAEFNIWVDPTAAKEVFEAFEVYMVGLNATHPAAISQAEFDGLLEICRKSKKNWLLLQLTEFSKRNSQILGNDNHVIHDAVAMASLIHPDVLKFEKAAVEVVDDATAVNHGQTKVDFEKNSGKTANCYVAMETNQPLFYAMLKEMCESYNA